MSKEGKKKGLINKAFGTKAIKDVFGHTKSMIKDANPTKDKYYKETFDEAMKRHGVKEEQEDEHLLKIYKNLKIQFLVMGVAGFGMLFFGTFNFLSSGEYLGAFSYLMIAFALTTLMAQYGLRCYQIRKKHLGMLHEFFKTPSQWYPRKITKQYLQNVEKER